MAIEDILARVGATSFEVAGTEAEAVTAAVAKAPKIITSDVRLLEGTGPATVAEIQRRFGSISVVFITGSPEACHPCNSPGSIVTKPFTDSAVIAAVRHVFPIR